MNKLQKTAQYDGQFCTTCNDECKWVTSCPKRKILILPYSERILIMPDILREKYNPSF